MNCNPVVEDVSNDQMRTGNNGSYQGPGNEAHPRIGRPPVPNSVPITWSAIPSPCGLGTDVPNYPKQINPQQ